jgi:hypothetical protein
MADDLSEVRRKAWKTRRAKYGPMGHSGIGKVYLRSPPISAEAIELARCCISSARRACQVLLLSDDRKHAERAIDQIDAADHLLGGILQPSLILSRARQVSETVTAGTPSTSSDGTS